jgi:hypothetical protein
METHRIDLLRNFLETDPLLDAERSERPSKLNDKKLVDISGSMLRSVSKSLCKVAQEKDIGFVTAHKAVRGKSNLFP